MNKIILTSSSILNTVKTALERGVYALRGEKYQNDLAPQWQQLELPFSRTPLKKWNR